MNRLELINRVPEKYERNTFVDIIRAITGKVNGVAEGRLAAYHNAQASVPTGTTAAYAVGDFIPDSNCTVRPSVAPGVAASYVRMGWVCTSPGTGATATFQEARVLTGA